MTPTDPEDPHKIDREMVRARTVIEASQHDLTFHTRLVSLIGNKPILDICGIMTPVIPGIMQRGKPHTPLPTVDGLGWEGRLNGVSLTPGKGEILGVGGLEGQGQKELLLAPFGVLKGVRGRVGIGGRKGLPASPVAAKNGATRIALVPEDRKTEGLTPIAGTAFGLTNGLILLFGTACPVWLPFKRTVTGRGRYAGTLVGGIMIVLRNSVLSIMQVPEAFRQIIHGSVIVGMLLVYGRGDRVTS